MLWVGLGTMLGNLLAGLLSRRGVELGLAPIGGFLLLGVLFAMGFTPFGGQAFTGLLVAAGFATGLFVVPLYAFLTTKCDPSVAARMVAANNIVNSGAMVIGSLIAAGRSAIGVPIVEQVLLSAVMCLVSAWLAARLYKEEKLALAAA